MDATKLVTADHKEVRKLLVELCRTVENGYGHAQGVAR